MTSDRTRRARWIDRVLIAATIVLGFFAVRGIGDINQDGALIDRGQQVTACIGDRQDAIDKWRAVATYEFTHQVDRSTRGLPISTSVAEEAERAIYALVDEKVAIRADHLKLIDEGPDAVFTCPPITDDLMPPPL